MPETVCWFGNSAKTAVIRRVVAEHPAATVLDFGCGDGGQWPAVLAACPTLRLIACDVSDQAVTAARQRLRGLNAECVQVSDLAGRSCEADVIVSFSVFEHVFDRAAYLATARRMLRPGGVFFLNYDDGHFRVRLDLARPKAWPGLLRLWLSNATAHLRARFGHIASFQAPVDKRELDRLLEAAGFRIEDEAYGNMESLKVIAPRVPEERRPEFMQAWSSLEAALNELFLQGARTDPHGYPALWQVMASRTLTLRPADGSGRHS